MFDRFPLPWNAVECSLDDIYICVCIWYRRYGYIYIIFLYTYSVYINNHQACSSNFDNMLWSSGFSWRFKPSRRVTHLLRPKWRWRAVIPKHPDGSFNPQDPCRLAAGLAGPSDKRALKKNNGKLQILYLSIIYIYIMYQWQSNIKIRQKQHFTYLPY